MSTQFTWIPHELTPEVQYGGHVRRTVTLFPDRADWGYRRMPVRFARFDEEPGAEVTVRLPGLPVRRAEVESLRPCGEPGIRADSVSFVPSGPGHYILRVNGSYACFLFIDPHTVNYDFLTGRTEIPGVEALRTNSTEVQTETLQGLIDKAASQRRGGVVRLPPGCYLTGTLHMRSGVYLHLHEDTVLLGTPDRSAYPVDPPVTGLSIARCRLLHFDGVEDSGVVGRGAINGNGSLLRHEALFGNGRRKRVPSNLVRIQNSRRIRFQDVFLLDSEFWNTHILASEDVSFANVRLINEIPPRRWDPLHPDYTWNNADGINPDASRNIRISDLFAYCGDDCLPVKNTGNAADATRASEDMRFARCTLISETTVMKIGTETCGPAFRDIVFEDILQLDSGAPMGVMLRDGALLENLVVRRLRSLRCRGAPYLTTEVRRPGQTHPPGRMRGITFEDWEVCPADKAWDSFPETKLEAPDHLENLVLRRIEVRKAP